MLDEKLLTSIVVVVAAILVAIFFRKPTPTEPILTTNDTSTQISIAVNKILDAFSPKALYSQKQNDFFLGALGVAIIGGITTSAYYILNRLWNYLINKFIVSITINNNEEA